MVHALRGRTLDSLRLPVLWALLGLGLLGLGRVAERRTPVELYSSGGHVEASVAGTRLSAPVAIGSVRAIEIFAMDSVDPPGGWRLEVTQDGRTVVSDRLPRRFPIPGRGLQPLGDWQLDEHAARGLVYRRQVDLSGDFELRAAFAGRFQHELEIVLVGSPTVGLALRRGLLNNDAAIRVDDGEPVTVTSIDPVPWSDLASALGVLLHAAGLAALLAAAIAVVSRGLAGTRVGAITLVWPDRTALAAVAVTAALAAVLLSAWCAGWVLEGLPHMPDSVTYLLQSRWLLAGHLSQQTGPLQHTLDLPFTYVVGGRWLAQYPVAWPALLALGTVTGLPWLVSPLLAGAYVWLLYQIGRELFSPAIGAMAAVLALISPLGRLLFASMFPHAAAATFILLSAWLMLLARRRATSSYGFAAGLAGGLAFGIRPLTALAILLPMGAFALLDRSWPAPGRRRLAAAAVAGGILALVPTLLANSSVTGSPFRFAYSLAHGTMYGLGNLPFGLRNMDALLASIAPSLYGWGWGLPPGRILAALALGLAVVPFLLRRAGRSDWMLAACMGALVVAFLGARANGLHGFGPRYYFEGFFALYLLTARGFEELGRLGGGATARGRAAAVLAALLFVVLNASALAVLPARLALYRGYNHVDGAMVRQLRAIGDERALVVFATPEWYNWAMASPLMGAAPEPCFVFATARGSTPALARRYSDRPVYVWQDGTLTPYRSADAAPPRVAAEPACPRSRPG